MSSLYFRECPECSKQIEYSSKKALQNAVKKNSKCKSCGLTGVKKIITEEGRRKRSISAKGSKNSMYGRSVYSVWLEKYGKEEADRRYDERAKKNKNSCKFNDSTVKAKIQQTRIKNNKPKFSNYYYWLKKYGKEEAERKLKEHKEKISKATSGENNPMYGKPSPNGSGNGWQGWYKEFRFRSLLELEFILHMERFGYKIKSAEKSHKIQYVNDKGKNRTYLPDFIVNDKFLIEIKPKSLMNSKEVLMKKKNAIEFCNRIGLKYKMIDPGKIKDYILLKLVNDGLVKFDVKYTEKFKEKYAKEKQ